MLVHFTHVNPPIPLRGNDWSCSLTDDEDAVRGWGATQKDALNNLLDNLEVEDIAAHFGITTRFIDPCRGPEYGHWAAICDDEYLEAPWRDQAIVDLAFKLAMPKTEAA